MRFKLLVRTFLAMFAIAFYMFWDYTLPSYSIVKIVEIDTHRMDKDGNFIEKDDLQAVGRDVFFILSKPTHFEKDPKTGEDVPVADLDKSTISVRNEDTGWRFPWYFKFDTTDLQGDAAALRDHFAVIETYGYRFQFWSWFANALSVSEYKPGMTIINWTRIVVWTIFAILAGFGYALYRRIKKRIAARVEAAAQVAREQAEALGSRVDAVGARVDAFSNSDGMQSARRGWRKLFGDWW
jgi:hypothetical protein